MTVLLSPAVVATTAPNSPTRRDRPTSGGAPYRWGRRGQSAPPQPNRSLPAVAVAAALTLGALGACAPEPFEATEGFFGGVSVDEPRAAIVARDTIVEGGNAVDAAVATYFTLAATLPSSAGFSAGGACVVFDPAKKAFERIVFPAIPASDAPDAIALPLGPRGIFAMHARYGRIRFPQLLGIAEQIARFGEPMSKRLAADVAGAADVLVQVDERTLLRPDGTPMAQGDAVIQLDLAATIGRMRQAGVGDLYQGQLAKRFVEGAGEAGHAVDEARLGQALPRWEVVEGASIGNHSWVVAGVGDRDRRYTETLLAMAQEGDWAALSAERRPVALAALAALAARATEGGGQAVEGDAAETIVDRADLASRVAVDATVAALTGDAAPVAGGATAFFTVDRFGQAVGCALGLGRPFGAGTFAGDTGIRLALAAPEGGVTGAPTAVALVVGNRNTWQTQLAAAASGGREAPVVLSAAVLEHFLTKAEPGAVIAAPRAHFAGADDRFLLEPGIPGATVSAIEAAGYSTTPVGSLGRATIFRCLEGIPISDPVCGVGEDHRRGGLTLFERSR